MLLQSSNAAPEAVGQTLCHCQRSRSSVRSGCWNARRARGLVRRRTTSAADGHARMAAELARRSAAHDSTSYNDNWC
jgi:hypothetical protein